MIATPRSWRLHYAAVCAGLMTVLTALVFLSWQPLETLDDRVINSAVAWTSDRPGLADPLSTLGVVSGKRILWTLTAVVGLGLWVARHRTWSLFVLGSVGSTTVVTGFLKRSLGRDRPAWYVPEDPLPTSSFPSGHVSLWVAFVAVLLAMLLQRQRVIRPGTARLASSVLVLLVTLICAQRVLLGRHYPSDVLAGVLVGAGCALLSWVVADVLARRMPAVRGARALSSTRSPWPPSPPPVG